MAHNQRIDVFYQMREQIDQTPILIYRLQTLHQILNLTRLNPVRIRRNRQFVLHFILSLILLLLALVRGLDERVDRVLVLEDVIKLLWHCVGDLPDHDSVPVQGCFEICMLFLQGGDLTLDEGLLLLCVDELLLGLSQLFFHVVKKEVLVHGVDFADAALVFFGRGRFLLVDLSDVLSVDILQVHDFGLDGAIFFLN